MSNCAEIIASEDIYEYIIENKSGIYDMVTSVPGVCAEFVNRRWLIVYGRLPQNLQLNINSLGYTVIPKVYGLSDVTSMDASGASRVLNQPFLDARGQGVLIGFIDTGIDYLRDNFKDSSGRSRIDAIWDQALTFEDNAFVRYGRVYENEEINEAIRLFDRGGDPYSVVETRDENGHGTFMAGVAASSYADGYYGVAPDSRLVCVKVRQAKQYLRDFYCIRDDVPAYAESDLMMAVSFLLKYADQKDMPLVIFLGMASGFGSRTGQSPLADVLDVAAERLNTVPVVPVGNMANAKVHFSGYSGVNEGFKEVEINVLKRGKGFTAELWARSLDVLSVSIISPTGELIPRIPARLGASNEFNFLFEGSRITVDYQIAEAGSGLEVIFMRFLTPAEGIWKIRVYSLTSLPGYFNIWLTPPPLIDGEAYFLDSDPDVTLEEPSSAARPISVAAYNHYTGGSDTDSGRGYTVDNRIKPEIAAPGVDVYGVRAGGGYTNKTGTSVAAAHVAGAVALFLSWGVTENNLPLIGNGEIKSFLIRGANRNDNIEYPNKIYGFGFLDIAGAFDQMRIS